MHSFDAPSHRGRRPGGGFTLIELLVVVTVIVILLALLVPGLAKALKMSEAALCATNESAIGKALAMLLNDRKRIYPVLDNYNGLLGNIGNTTVMGSDHHGGATRPLNPYLGYNSPKGARTRSAVQAGAADSVVKVAQCPSDAGDPFLNLVSAYEAVGVSYMPQMCYDDFRTKHVFGWNGHGRSPVNNITTPLPADAKASMRSTSIERPDNKIILADWPWHGDRLYSDERTRWHDDEERRFNTLFADGRVKMFAFPREEIENADPQERYKKAANPSFLWW